MEALLTETRSNWPAARATGKPTEQASSWLQYLARPPRSRVWRPCFRLFDLACSSALAFVYFLLSHQPQRHPLLLARPLAWLIRAPIKRPILRRLRTVFADRDWSPSRYGRLWGSFLDHVGLSLVEPLRLECMEDAELRRRITIVGEEHLQAALNQGRGVMLFINHIGESGAVPALGRFGYDLTWVTDPMPVPYFERRLDMYCAKMRVRRLVISGRTAFEVGRAFARGGVVAAYTDISLTPRRGEWVPFGPAEVRLHPGPAILAVRHRVPVLYANTERLADNHHRLTLSSPLRYDPADLQASVRSLLHQATQVLHAEVRRRPEQWWALDFVDVRPRQTWPSDGLEVSVPLRRVIDREAVRAVG